MNIKCPRWGKKLVECWRENLHFSGRIFFSFIFSSVQFCVDDYDLQNHDVILSFYGFPLSCVILEKKIDCQQMRKTLNEKKNSNPNRKNLNFYIFSCLFLYLSWSIFWVLSFFSSVLPIRQKVKKIEKILKKKPPKTHQKLCAEWMRVNEKCSSKIHVFY